ncbi:serine hydrolase domain-containing protein [Polaribacter porphyrae]|uniref:Beta-lactamase-related domain-containing protein n=1 Tax=Polaribacter porphyrae TaxID=1137780 RepID=A0A2S7WLX3_9FLAO|nr:serine hydrolase domain-containing protein [Polaribacter porphyrae]PQJ78600.1 hypothetical protein BTO18_05095 [Polaribacter porphyrae]
MKKYFWVLLSLNTIIFSAQNRDNSIEKLEHRLDSLINKTMKSEHIPGASFIIVKNNKTLLKKGYGFTSLGQNANYIHPDSTIFRIGSITKTFTAFALLQELERKKIKVTDDISKYLLSVKIPDTFSEPITFHHLLTHSAGFDEIGGRRIFQENLQIPLAVFLNSNLVRIRKPGIISAYSSYGIAVAGQLVEDLSGLSLEDYMRKNIWSLLEMKKTSINLPENDRNYLSLGYEMYNGINLPQPWEWYHTFPASSINSTVSDMGNYIKMLLNNGNYKGKQILSKRNVLKMQSQQLSIQPEVFGFAYGFYEKHQFRLKVYNHGGDMLGYSSLLTLVPEINLGIYIVHHHESTSLRKKVMELVLEYFGKKNIIQPNPKRIYKDVSKFAGSYKWMSECYTCSNNKKVKKYQLVKSNNNTLSGFGRKFYQVKPLVFKSFDGKRIMGFLANKKGEIKYMSLGNVNSFEKIE